MERIPGAVRVRRGQGSVVTRVHRLEHVQGLAATHLTHHDAVRPHTQGVDDQLANAHRALPLDVRGTGLEPDHVPLLELQLRRVLNGDDPLVAGEEARHDIEQRRLPRRGAPRDDDVEPRLHASAEELDHLLRDAPHANQIIRQVRRRGELADADARTVQGQWRDDDVDAGAVGQAGVDHRAALVHPPSQGPDDPVDDAHDLLRVPEADVRLLEPPVPLDPDLFHPVDHDLGDGVVAEKRFNRTQAEDVRHDLFEEIPSLPTAQRDLLLCQRLVEDPAQRVPHLSRVAAVDDGAQLRHQTPPYLVSHAGVAVALPTLTPGRLVETVESTATLTHAHRVHLPSNSIYQLSIRPIRLKNTTSDPKGFTGSTPLNLPTYDM